MPNPPQPESRLESAAPTKQIRSEATLGRILDAAEALIRHKGLADASIPEIARRARSSVGGIYARFKDKDAMLIALEERFFRNVMRRVEELAATLSGESIADIANAAANTLVSIVRQDRNLIAAFVHRATADPASLAELLRFRAQVSARLTDLLRSRLPELRHRDPELAIDLGIQFALALMIQLVLVGEVRAAGRVLSDPELQAEIEENFLAYIGAASRA